MTQFTGIVFSVVNRETIMKKQETNRRALKIKRKLEICDKAGKCDYCPIHGGENWRRKPKEDKHKNINRSTIRKEY